MRRKTAPKLLTMALAICAALVLVTSGTAGRAWCRADPVLIINGDVVDIQASSSLEMYQSATGPIQMVVRVPKGTNANVLLNDFGFGYGYDIKIEKVKSLKSKKARAEVALFAPATDSTLPVGVHGIRVGTNLSWLFKGKLDLLWIGQSHGSANEWIELVVY